MPATETTTEELKAIADAVREFARDEIEPNSLKWDQEKHFPADVLRKAAELGLGAVWAGEDVGGSELTRLAGVHIFEELARGCPSLSAYTSIHNMVVSMIDTYGSTEQRERWVPQLATMETFGSYCLTEPGAGSDAAALSTRATRTEDGYVLNGVKQFISGAGESGIYVVMARTGDKGAKGISAFVLEKGTDGLSFGPNEVKMGWNNQPTRQVIMENVHVKDDQLLGEEGQGFTIAMRGLNSGRLNIAACSLGGAQWAMEKAVDYLRSRVAFGKPLLEQQALQFRLADMQTSLQASRLMLHDAAARLDAEGHTPAVAATAAAAKRFVTDTCFAVANDALQLHGGYGYLHEYGIEKVVRDLRVHQILEGTNEIMRLIVSRALVDGVK